MPEIESRRIIEALRSGVPSRAVGSYFTEARPKLMARMDSALKQTSREGKSHGMIIKGRYGEGKTHLLNTVLSMAHAENMVVSIIPISKEIPMNKLFLVYQKLMFPKVPVGYTSMLATLLFVGGMIMLLLGLIGEYVGRIYISINQSPQYVVRERTF